MIHDSLFSPPQSPFFVLSKSLFLPPQSLGFVLFRVLVSPFSKSRFLPSLSVPFLSLRPLPSSFVLSPPPILVPVLSVLFLPLQVLSHPLPQSQRKQRNDTKPSRRSWFVPKWNMILSLLVRPQTAVARFENLVSVVSARQLLSGLAANVLVHSNVKHAVIARPAAHK